MNGLWALFLCSLAVAAAVVALRAGSLQFVVENIQEDSYDTILGVQVFHASGPFGTPPYLNAPLFGSFPLLFPALGAAIDLVLNDPAVSASVLYWLTCFALIAVIWEKFLKKADLKTRLLFISLFLFSIGMGNMFPLGFRKRQELALLLSMGVFLSENALSSAALGFLALMAQPFTGGLAILAKAAYSIDKKRYDCIVPLAAAIVLALPFYSNLFQISPLPPQMSGCGYAPEQPFLFFYLAFMAVVAIHIWGNRRSAGLLEYGALAIIGVFPLSVLTFRLLASLGPLAPAWLVDSFLSITSLPCNGNLYAVSALCLLSSVAQKRLGLPTLAVALLLLLNIHSILAMAGDLYLEKTLQPAFSLIIEKIHDSGIANLKTMGIWAAGYSGSAHLRASLTMFGLQSYSILHGGNLSFVGESSLPPQLSKGNATGATLSIIEALASGDGESCASYSRGLKAGGVQGILYLVSYDRSLGTLPGPMQGGLNSSRFSDNALLRECGLSLAWRTDEFGSPDSPEDVFLYKIG